MGPHVIKFVSVDKLSTYQLWPSRSIAPEYVLSRSGFSALRCASAKDDLCPGLCAHRRFYELYARYVDETNGNIVWEYREKL